MSILNFFADNPGRSFSMTDLVRALKINQATVHGMLAELVEANYLFRTNDKTYLLGSAVARLGTVATKHLSPLQVASPEMREIADEFGLICSALFRDRNEVVVRERAVSATKLDWYQTPVYRWPLQLPGGALFFISSPPAQIEAWLDSLSPPPTLEMRARTFEGLAFAREHGFQFVVTEKLDGEEDLPSEWQYMVSPSEWRLVVETGLDPDKSYRIVSIGSPVHDAQGRVAFLLGLSAFDRPHSGAEIGRIGARLKKACQTVSQFLKGFPG